MNLTRIPRVSQQRRHTTTHQITAIEALNWLIRRAARIEDKLNRLHQKIDRNERFDKERDENMSAETKAAFAELQAEVAEDTNATSALVTVVDNLVAQLEATQDPAEIKAITAQLKANRDALIAAALKGTPAA